MLTFQQVLLFIPERLFKNHREDSWHFKNVHREAQWHFGRNPSFVMPTLQPVSRYDCRPLSACKKMLWKRAQHCCTTVVGDPQSRVRWSVWAKLDYIYTTSGRSF